MICWHLYFLLHLYFCIYTFYRKNNFLYLLPHNNYKFRWLQYIKIMVRIVPNDDIFSKKKRDLIVNYRHVAPFYKVRGLGGRFSKHFNHDPWGCGERLHNRNASNFDLLLPFQYYLHPCSFYLENWRDHLA